jgi:FkbM family methyltransferase
MDVFLFASKGSSADKETSPLVLKEAIGWGMPVLMRRLPVYNGMHDKFSNVHYIGEDLKANLEIINKFKKSYKKSYLKEYSLRDHPWKVCIDLVVDSSEFKNKVKYIIFKDSKNNLTIYFVEALNGRYEGWVELNAVKKDLNGVDFYLYDENGNLLENKNLINFNHEKNIQVTIDNKIIKMDHYFQDTGAWFIFYEVFMCKDYEGVKKGGVVVDVGANIGMFSAYALKHKASKVFSIEPAFDTFERLKKNVGTFENVTLINKGISKEKGKSYLFASPHSSGISSGFFSNNHNDQTPKQTINTIDFTSLIKEHDIKKIDFLKIDCEGAEIDLFENVSEDYLENNINKIVCEIHSFAFSRENYEKTKKSKLTKCGFKIREEPVFSDDDWQSDEAIAFLLTAEKKEIKK